MNYYIVVQMMGKLDLFFTISLLVDFQNEVHIKKGFIAYNL